MNRIILIGNGFDLAHGLKTSYRDFIDNFWEKKLETFLFAYNNMKLGVRSELITKKNDNNRYYFYQYNDNEFIIDITNINIVLPTENISLTYKGYNKLNYIVSCLSSNVGINNIKINNYFLKRITFKQELKNWVDIEEEYYLALNECLINKKGIEELNKEFLFIQKALENYLTEQMSCNFSKSDEIMKNIYSSTSRNEIQGERNVYVLVNTLYLSFNYTNTEKIYQRNTNTDKFIKIHGELNNQNNPIIFGYGDELDERYKQIEQENDNKYLENIKSFKYLMTRNYQELLNFIESDKYQIFIMGHSCGNSDRTLLNTLFEHKNCLSIRIFYHMKDDKNNFNDVIMNISRNFTNKQKMREILVTLPDSKPLMG